MSEIVVPVTPMIAFKQNRKSELLGFLCVDCSKKNVFNKRYDIPLIQGVADGIYDLLEKIKILQETETRTLQET
jgi:hypothetical protein